MRSYIKLNYDREPLNQLLDAAIAAFVNTTHLSVFCQVSTFMVHTNATNLTTNSFTSFQTRILAQKNCQRIRPF
jgi:hypothetical protein